MRIVAIIESDDCGPAAVLDAENITITKINDLYIAASRCMYRNSPVVCEISKEVATKLMLKGVRCLDFNDSTTVADNEKD
jgi:uncharacterized protein (DUF39 family)